MLKRLTAVQLSGDGLETCVQLQQFYFVHFSVNSSWPILATIVATHLFDQTTLGDVPLVFIPKNRRGQLNFYCLSVSQLLPADVSCKRVLT